jgi:hypothetical protein
MVVLLASDVRRDGAMVVRAGRGKRGPLSRFFATTGKWVPDSDSRNLLGPPC